MALVGDRLGLLDIGAEVGVILLAGLRLAGRQQRHRDAQQRWQAEGRVHAVFSLKTRPGPVKGSGASRLLPQGRCGAISTQKLRCDAAEYRQQIRIAQRKSTPCQQPVIQ
ncbi:hypothetical protein Hsero_3623 [Herbaspirillum seropedicae SmR1]|uniref:Uncharacterized protein n=1 Tax=Herbaspirillum seropedicae (strain SmR1) TaxID=757424 RepID=D8IQI9_HERSS|nr:hypothetical protein Hsero_3623 [Herbaspirillum seropedicae SmR1]